MKITINVSIEQEPSDSPGVGWGNGMRFSEDVALPRAGFEVVSKVFTRCHELLETMREDHRTIQR